jgi:NADPH-dependent 2,4-dienoyl-CoA reductase/sulfur reductase-like enzyme
VIVDPRRVVVAGAGLAGLRTVEQLRERGYGGEITLIGAEPRPPYDRPPLSKKVMAGVVDDTSLPFDPGALGVTARFGESACQLDGDVLRTTSGGACPFDALVLAVGSEPIRLPGQGPQRTLRTLDDALALRALLRPGLRLAIAGAGLIGAELATAAVAAGASVTVVEAAQAPMLAAVGPQIAAVMTRWYEDAGVELRLATGVGSVEDGGLALAGGSWLAADEVVTAIGARPRLGWLDGSGIAVDRCVAVNERLRSSAPQVFAVGDCAAYQSRRYGRSLRFEHWDIALHAPEVAAANVLGGDEVFDPVPYFWTEQFGRMVQYAGLHSEEDRLVWRGDPAGERFSAAWLDAEGRLTALLAVGVPKDVVQARRLLAAGPAPADEAALADPSVPVRSAVQAAVQPSR